MSSRHRNGAWARLPGAGFTLIELLVVVGIIGLLMAILLPALGLARAQAQKITCAANMRNWGQAAATYAGDNNNYFPDNMEGFDFAWNSNYVRDRFIGEYLTPIDLDVTSSDHNVLYCPTDTWHRFQNPQTVYNGCLVGFQWLPHRNVNAAGHGYGQIAPWAAKTQFDGPYARAPFMMDIMQSMGSATDPREARRENIWFYIPGQTFSAHPDGDGVPTGSNYAFEDGSVQWHNFEEMEMAAPLGAWRIWGYIEIAGLSDNPSLW